MAKSVDFDKIVDEVDQDSSDFGDGIETEILPDDTSENTPEVEDESDPPLGEIDEEPEPEEEQITFRSLLSERGLNVPDDADEVEVLGNLLDRYSQAGEQMRRMQAEQQQLQQYVQQYQYMLHQQQQKPLEQTTRSATERKPLTGALKHWESVPEWNENWSKLVRRDEEGNLVAVPGADPTLPQKYMQRLEWEERAQRTFFENPQQFLLESFQANPDFQNAIQQQIQQAVAQVQDRFEAQQITAQMKPYLQDESGQWNEAGLAYTQAIEHAEKNLGIYGTQQLHALGLQAATPYIRMMQAQQQAPPEEKPAEVKKKRQINFLKKQAERKPNRGQSAEKRAKVRPPRDAVDLEKQMIEQMKDMGIDLDARAVV